MKVTKRQLKRIIREELAHSVPLHIGGPVTAPIEVPAKEEKGMAAKALDESMAAMLVGLSQGDNKNAVASLVKKVGAAPMNVVSRVVDAFCDKVSSWSGWGEYQGAANKVCKILGKVIGGAVGPAQMKLVWNGVALALNVVDAETLNDFAAETYPDTRAGKQALRKKTARIAAEKKTSVAKRKAVKESIRRIVDKEINKR